MTFQFFDIIKNENDTRDIKGIILKNNIKIVLISDPNIINSGCCVGIGAGYLNDKYEGSAHFLEHLLFMGSKKYPKQNEFLNYISNNLGYSNAYTEMNSTCYYLSIGSTKLKKAVEIFSWFFKSPLLDEKNIKSEMEIINSEHEKNKNSDFWIIDDIFKNFIITKKYKSFGTGNNDSLNNIKYDDIMDFYNKHYTTDNTFVCIIDSLSLDDIIKNYIPYFEDIEKRTSNNNDKKEDIEKRTSNNNDKKEDLKLIENNLIIFKSISDYKILNIYLILNLTEKYQDEYQLIKFINHLITKQYEKSLSYILFEKYDIKSMHSSPEYFLDNQTIIIMTFILNNDDYHTILNCVEEYLKVIENINYEDFSKLFNNYKNIKKIKSLYKSKDNVNDEMSMIVDNLINSDSSLCLNKNYVFEEVNKKLYNKYITILKDRIIKIVSNIGFDEKNKNNNNIIKSTHYNSKYYISNIKYSNKNKYDFNLMNMILIKNVNIKYLENNLDIKRKHEIIQIDNNKKIYYFKEKKYGNLVSITVIRKNTNLIKEINNIFISIYQELIVKLLNYYLHTMTDYNLYCVFYSFYDYYLLTFYGIDIYIKDYVIKIMDFLTFDNIFNNKDIDKYFNSIIKNMIDSINNDKYTTPYLYTLDYVNKIILNKFSNSKIIRILKKIDLDSLKNKYNDIFNVEQEYILLDGITDIDFIKNNVSTKNIVLNNKKLSVIKCVNVFNYTIKKSDIIKTEKNNCLCSCSIVENINLIYDKNNIVDNKLFILIIKKNIIYNLLSNMISEPLFNELRTKAKLGYVVKCIFKHFSTKNNLLMTIMYLIQSHEEIDKIKDEINKFNLLLIKKFNNKQFKNDFEKHIKLKLLELEKYKLDNIRNETRYYKNILLSNSENFDLIEFKINILKNIKFKELLDAFNIFINKKHNYVIYH